MRALLCLPLTISYRRIHGDNMQWHPYESRGRADSPSSPNSRPSGPVGNRVPNALSTIPESKRHRSLNMHQPCFLHSLACACSGPTSCPLLSSKRSNPTCRMPKKNNESMNCNVHVHAPLKQPPMNVRLVPLPIAQKTFAMPPGHDMKPPPLPVLPT